MSWIIQMLNLDIARQREGFARQWQLAEVRIMMVAGADVGWLQTVLADDAPRRRERRSRLPAGRRRTMRR
jgi:hypothetical protein